MPTCKRRCAHSRPLERSWREADAVADRVDGEERLGMSKGAMENARGAVAQCRLSLQGYFLLNTQRRRGGLTL